MTVLGYNSKSFLFQVCMGKDPNVIMTDKVVITENVSGTSLTLERHLPGTRSWDISLWNWPLESFLGLTILTSLISMVLLFFYRLNRKKEDHKNRGTTGANLELQNISQSAKPAVSTRYSRSDDRPLTDIYAGTLIILFLTASFIPLIIVVIMIQQDSNQINYYPGNFITLLASISINFIGSTAIPVIIYHRHPRLRQYCKRELLDFVSQFKCFRSIPRMCVKNRHNSIQSVIE